MRTCLQKPNFSATSCRIRRAYNHLNQCRISLRSAQGQPPRWHWYCLPTSSYHARLYRRTRLGQGLICCVYVRVWLAVIGFLWAIVIARGPSVSQRVSTLSASQSRGPSPSRVRCTAAAAAGAPPRTVATVRTVLDTRFWCGSRTRRVNWWKAKKNTWVPIIVRLKILLINWESRGRVVKATDLGL